MIVKIIPHKTAAFKRVLEYMAEHKKRLYDKEGGSFAITHNVRGNDIGMWVKQFQENEAYRNVKRKDSVYLTHEVLSWHRDDARHITLSKMEDMAREYINQRNPRGMYVAVPHFDKKHYHIHIMASGIEYRTGKSLRLSIAGMQELKQNIQKYQIAHFPELSKSLPEHGKKEKPRLTEKEYQLKLRTGRESEKEHLIGMLKTCYKKADSQKTFFKLLNELSIPTYDRSGKTTGVTFRGYKFRFSRLGFTEERINELDRAKERSKELSAQRNLKSKNIELNK